MVGSVGADAHGAFVRGAVAASGVDVSRIRVQDGVATGTAIITVDANAENTIVVSSGANRMLNADDLPSLAGIAVVTMSLEIPVAVVLATARAARAAGTVVVLNLSPHVPVPDELFDVVDVLVVNEHEAALVGEHPVRRFIVTYGANGCRVHDHGAVTEVDAFRGAPVDTPGSGDAFLAAVAVRLAKGDTLADAARYAVRVAAWAVTIQGAQLPELDEEVAQRFRI